MPNTVWIRYGKIVIMLDKLWLMYGKGEASKSHEIKTVVMVYKKQTFTTGL